MATDPDSFLMGGVKYPTALTSAKIGDSVEGTVVSRKVTQQTSMKGDPLFWDNGEPREQLVVVIQTTKRDPAIEDDDGKRRLFFKFKMLEALREALKSAGEPLKVGGYVKVTKSGEEAPKEKGLSPTNLYTVTYTPAVLADAAAEDTAAEKKAEASVDAAQAEAAKAAFDALPAEVKALLLKQQG